MAHPSSVLDVLEMSHQGFLIQVQTTIAWVDEREAQQTRWNCKVKPRSPFGTNVIKKWTHPINTEPDDCPFDKAETKALALMRGGPVRLTGRAIT